MNSPSSANRTCEIPPGCISPPKEQKKKSKKQREQKLRETTFKIPPNTPLVMSQAAENLRRAEGWKSLPSPPHVDEWVSIMFRLGFITGDSTKNPPTEITEYDSDRMSDILRLWLNEVSFHALPMDVGRNIGYHIFHCAPNKGASLDSVQKTVDLMQEHYLQLSQEIADEDTRAIDERGGPAMGTLLKEVVGESRIGRELPGLLQMGRVASKLLGVFHAASIEISEKIAEAKMSGI